MSNEVNNKLAVDKLRAVLATRSTDSDLKMLIDGQPACIARYQPIFSPQKVSCLTAEQFKSFLSFENNRHWSGLNRKGHLACSDMNALRKALSLLLDESKPIASRMDKVVNEIPGMGKALVTAILLVAFPDKYGVWNGTSEAALMALKVWPDFARGLSFGQKYEVVNRALLGLAKELNVDLWTLDALHWRAVPEVRGTDDELPVSDETNEYGQCFGLERHLHQFLFDNWDQTSLGKEWALYTVPGDAEAGYEYPTDIGRIDLLAKHRRQNRWLVVELKRGQSSDDTVGQILRYVAWVRQHLAGKNEKIEGLIICHEIDERLRYAVSEIQHVRAMVYEVSFSLKDDTGNKQKGNLT